MCSYCVHPKFLCTGGIASRIMDSGTERGTRSGVTTENTNATAREAGTS